MEFWSVKAKSGEALACERGSVFVSGYTTTDHEALDGFPDDEDLESSEDEGEGLAQIQRFTGV